MEVVNGMIRVADEESSGLALTVKECFIEERY